MSDSDDEYVQDCEESFSGSSDWHLDAEEVREGEGAYQPTRYRTAEEVLNEWVFVVDAQSLVPVTDTSENVTCRAALNPVVELSITVVKKPLSIRRMKVFEKVFLCQPTVEKTSKMMRDVMRDEGRAAAAVTHQIVPQAFRRSGAKDFDSIHKTETFKNVARRNEMNEVYCIQQFACNTEHAMRINGILQPWLSDVNAFLTLESRKREVEAALKTLKKYGLDLGEYTVFGYETVAGGSHFLPSEGVASDFCAYHKEFAQHGTHCCRSTVCRLSTALEHAAQELHVAHHNNAQSHRSL